MDVDFFLHSKVIDDDDAALLASAVSAIPLEETTGPLALHASIRDLTV